MYSYHNRLALNPRALCISVCYPPMLGNLGSVVDKSNGHKILLSCINTTDEDQLPTDTTKYIGRCIEETIS